MTIVDDRVAELCKIYPEWIIWRSGAGRWWANRMGGFDPRLLQAGRVATLDADDREALIEKLEAQKRIGALA